MTWDVIGKLRSITKAKLVIKGIETHEDAERCVEHGADGLVVSNHGARATESGRGTIDCLPEIVESVKGRIPILIDGGFRRGTDIFKALALAQLPLASAGPMPGGFRRSEPLVLNGCSTCSRQRCC